MELHNNPDYISRKKKSALYMQLLQKTKQGLGFHNCAGFVKYLIGLTEREIYAGPNDVSDKGILKYLEQRSVLYLKDFDDEKYKLEARDSDAIALLHNNNGTWSYLHFFVPDPDLDHPFQIFQRNGFEEEHAEKADVREVIKDKEYKGETIMVFFNKKV